jgi:hypothetical protein
MERTVKRIALALVVAACNLPAPPPAMPWIGGLATTASGDIETPAAAERLRGAVHVRDDLGYGAIALPTSFGTILASAHQGVAVVDANDHLIARAPGFDVEGSADDLVAVAVGDAQLDKPVIVVAITRGGHRASTTSILVYQLGEHARLDQLLAVPIEEHDGDQTFAGSLTFVAQAVLYRSPHGGLEPWAFDASARRYVPARAPHPRST